MKSYSQSHTSQDLWVLETLEYKRNGIFVDIGCATPFYISNTALLEEDYGWSGLGFDIDFSNQSYFNGASNPFKNTKYNDWRTRTKTRLYDGDALSHDYEKIFKDNNFPTLIDYLSIDLEPPEITLEVFKNLPHEKYKFRVITFEHDSYRRSHEWLLKTRKIVTSYGYDLVCQREQDDFYVISKF